MRGRKRVHLAGLAAAAVLLGAGAARPESYRNDTYHFGLEINSYWQPLSATELAEGGRIVDESRAQATPGWLVDGFRRKAAQPWNQPPVILINFVPAKLSHLSVEELERETGGGIERGLREAFNSNGDIAQLTIGTAKYDGERKRLVLRAKAVLKDGAKFELLAAGHVGAEGIVCLTYLTTNTATDREVAFFDRVNDSFRFDSGYEFVSTEQQRPLLERLLNLQTDGLGKPALVGGGVLVVVVLIGLLSGRKEK